MPAFSIAKIKNCIVLCFCLQLLTVVVSVAIGRQTQSKTSFLDLKKYNSPSRIDRAMVLYKDHYRRLSERVTMAKLDELVRLAKDWNDVKLECAVFEMRADYYSVNRGYNSVSTNYYQKAITFAQEHGLQAELAAYLHKKAVYYSVYKKNDLACQYFLRSQEQFFDYGVDKVPDISIYFNQVGRFFYSIGDFSNAKTNFENALKYGSSRGRTQINVITSLGLIYRSSENYAEALTYFNKALRQSIAEKDSIWTTISQGNIGSVYYLQKNYALALPLVTVDYQSSLKYKEYLNAAIALLRLIDMSVVSGDIEKASRQLNQFDQLYLKVHFDKLPLLVDYFKLRAHVYEINGDLKHSLQYRKRYEAARDSLIERDNIAAVERTRLNYATDKYHSQYLKIKGEAELGAFKRNAAIAGLLLVTIIIALVYNQQRLETKKNKELLEAERRRVDEELKNASAALSTYTESLRQKNKLIDEFKSEVDRLQVKFEDRSGALQLETMMQAHIMTEESWIEFKKLFSRVHTTFFYNLRKRYPHLSSTDTRLLSLIRLRLNNREMAGMLGITIDGIKKAKQRLRKKMDLSTDEQMEDVISAL